MTVVQTNDSQQALRAHATASLCGAADDPTWGLYGQRQRIISSQGDIEELHSLGIKALTWIEGFGTAGNCYIAEVRRGEDGEWIRDPRDPDIAREFRIHWDWQLYEGTGEIRWVGAHNYFEDEDFARPYTRTHPRYGGPPMTYPDGRIATGYLGPSDDPRNSAVYDAGCSKDVLGRVACDYDYNESVNRIDKATGLPHGPLIGLIDTGEAIGGTPDPGFTPEEWAQLKRRSYSGCACFAKDSACPVWIDYARASIRQALDVGIDGLWVDNFSPWDSFYAQPVQRAFGEWSVAGFRPYLSEVFGPERLAGMGIESAEQFDVRDYMKAKCREFGGEPTNLHDPAWSDPRWRDDPVWRAYVIYKRQAGTAALSAFYHAIKDEAAAAGKPDFLVSGNDTPVFSLGWVRGDLDMVSTELTWGWWLTTGPRGLMPPPIGSYVPVYKLAREHARSRFVNAWMYVPEEYKEKANLTRVLYYQALANHASPMPNYGGRTVGNEAVDAECFGFIRDIAPTLGDRVPVDDVGLYYSSSSQLMEMLPGGFRDMSDQPHSFAFYGWATALTWLHAQWLAVPEWKLTPEELHGLRVLIIPESEVFPEESVPVVEAWVRAGGRLIITGASGRRLGEPGNFDLAERGSTLSPLIEDRRVLYLADDPGRPFYIADRDRESLLPAIGDALATAQEGLGPAPVEADDVPWAVELSMFSAPERLYVDVCNTAIDLEADTVTPTPPLRIALSLPPDLRGKPLEAHVLSPTAEPSVEIRELPDDRVEVMLGPVSIYACVVIAEG